jgi:phosphoglycolate phosphatase-like HAD superfamily hydrolase
MLRRAPGDRLETAYRTYLIANERDHSAYHNLFESIPSIIAMLKVRGVRVGLVTGKGKDSAQIPPTRTSLDASLHAFETESEDGLAMSSGTKRVWGRGEWRPRTWPTLETHPTTCTRQLTPEPLRSAPVGRRPRVLSPGVGGRLSEPSPNSRTP